MKVTLLTLNNFTHDTRIHRTAKSLSQAGHSVTVVALWQEGLPVSEDHSSGYRIERLPLASRSWSNRVLGPVVKYLEYAWKLYRRARKHPADLYHANDANTLPAAWLAARRSHAGLIYDAHELETGRNWTASRVAGIYQHLHAWPEKLFIRQADAVITVNQSIAERLVTQYHIPMPAVVMNCPEGAENQSVRSHRLMEELGIPAGARIALYQGSVTQGRGIEPFVLAIQQVPGVVGVILGDGWLLDDLRRRVRSGELQNLYLPGKVDPVILPEYTVAADVGMVLIEPICESYRLSLPNKLFEYLHAGAAVIGSDLPEISRVIRESGAGVVVKSLEPVGIASALQSILEPPQTLESYRKQALEAAKAYSWEKEQLKLLAVYDRFSADESSL